MATLAGTNWGGTKSRSKRECTLGLIGSDAILSFPIEVTTKVFEVKEMIKQKLGIEGEFQFIVKNASSYINLQNHEEMRSNVTVRGIKSFEREKCKYPHPFAVIGAGHNGLRQGLMFHQNNLDWVMFDRHPIVGGTAWVTNANPTSKLQSELGTYHMQYDVDSPVPKLNGKQMSTWPHRKELLEHFQSCCEEYGLLPHITLSTNVSTAEMIEDKRLDFVDPKREHFSLITEKTDGSSEDESVVLASALIMYPGGLSHPKRVEYKGEDVFDGQMGYGMFTEFDYTKVTGEVVTVIGMGAFAVENVRTCLENDATKCFLLCRRKNITVPRLVDWWINQSLYPPPAKMMLEFMEKIYNFAGEDPWSYYAVNASKDRSAVTIRQQSRFGIGDAFYLATYYGKCELVVDDVKRLKPEMVVLESGDRLDCQHVIKVIGFIGDKTADTLCRVKEMVGFHVNSDHRRWICAEFPGVDFGRIGGTSLSPGAVAQCTVAQWFLLYPKDFQALMMSGLMPKKKDDPDSVRPTYVWDPRTGASIYMMYGAGVAPGLAEVLATHTGLNRVKTRALHSLEHFYQECVDDWVHYCEMFKRAGDARPFPPYPYELEDLKYWVERNDREGKEEQDKMFAPK